MNGLCAKLFFIVLFSAFMEQHRVSSFQVEMKGRFEQLALPRVTCYDHKIEAVFGPMVKANIHVQGKETKQKNFKQSLLQSKYIKLLKGEEANWQFYVRLCFVCPLIVTTRPHRGNNICAELWRCLWSECDQGEEPELHILEQIWQLLRSDWGQLKALF